MVTKRQRIVNEALAAIVPMIPLDQALRVKQLAAKSAMRDLPAQNAVWLALVSHVRHAHTDYDQLLEEGYDRESARHFVLDDINNVLQSWQAKRFLTADDVDSASDYSAS